MPNQPTTLNRRHPAQRDILDQIDDAVRARCACGCGDIIGEFSPSAYYSTPACQARWMRQHVDDPDAVYDRPDAAVYPAHDAETVALTDTGTYSMPDGGTVQLVGYGPGHLPPAYTHLAYLVDCPSCGAETEPVVYVDSSWNTPTGHECGACAEPLPEPVLLPEIRDDGDALRFVLGSRHGRIAYRRRAAIATIAIWMTLRQRLTVFERRWTGRPAGSRP